MVRIVLESHDLAADAIVVPMRSVSTAALRTDRLVLTSLQPADASEMVTVLSDSALYSFTGGSPPSVTELESRYRAQVAGPPTGDEVWHNWIIRLAETGIAVGFVQATVSGDASDIAWVVGVDWQGQGIATEAATAMCERLASDGVERFTAHIHPKHAASGRVAASLGLLPTDEVDSDGEVVWASPPQEPAHHT